MLLSVFTDLFGNKTVWEWLSYFCDALVCAPFVIYGVFWLYHRMGWDINGKKISAGKDNE